MKPRTHVVWMGFVWIRRDLLAKWDAQRHGPGGGSRAHRRLRLAHRVLVGCGVVFALLWLVGQHRSLWCDAKHWQLRVGSGSIGLSVVDDTFPPTKIGFKILRNYGDRGWPMPYVGGDQSGWDVTMPYWLLILMVVVCDVVVLLLRRRRWLPAECCQACGYDLTGNASGRCPECGAACQNSHAGRYTKAKL